MGSFQVGTSPGDPLKPFRWFTAIDHHGRHEGGPAALVHATVGFLVGGVLLWLDYTRIGIIVCTFTAVIGGISFASDRGRVAIQRCFSLLGRVIGLGLGLVILVPVYVLGFSLVSVWQRLAGSDPLQLRDGGRESFWVESDSRRRKLRWVHTMFATERLGRSGRRWLPLTATLIVVVLAAELTLRAMGFGHPLLYVNDPQVGYYPAPNQNVTRYGGRVITNRFGMRAPDYSRNKPAGTLRILMIGDSTLYGGSYIAQDELYCRLLERKLNASLPEGKVEVLSIGVNAWGPFHKLGYIERYGAFDADVAVVCMPYGDIYRAYYGLEAVPFFSSTYPPQCAIEEFVGHLNWRYRKRMAGQCTAEARREQGQRGIEAYVRLAQSLRRRGCEVVFEILPSRSVGTTGKRSSQERQATEQLHRALAAEGFTNFGYPIGCFQGRGTAEALYHDECHLHRQGHRLYAGYLHDRIMRHSDRLARWSQECIQAKRLETKGEPIRR